MALASDCKTLVTLTGGSHCQFAEYNPTCGLGELSCPVPDITRTEQHALVAQFLMPWLAAMLKEDNEARDTFECLLENEEGITYNHKCHPVSVASETPQTDIPSLFRCQNYPNPFNPTTTISYSLPVQNIKSKAEREGKGALDFELSTLYVTLKVFNLLGQEVATLVDEVKEAGYYSVDWDASDMAGGIYFYRFTAGSFTETRSMILMK
jgi:hypothetical protein